MLTVDVARAVLRVMIGSFLTGLFLGLGIATLVWTAVIKQKQLVPAETVQNQEEFSHGNF